MHPIIYLLTSIIGFYSFIVFLMLIVSLLLQFRVLNLNNLFVFRVNDVLIKLTEPALRPIRRRLPDMGGIDISPIVLLIGLNVLEYTLKYYFG